jgi:hypothetical protein
VSTLQLNNNNNNNNNNTTTTTMTTMMMMIIIISLIIQHFTNTPSTHLQSMLLKDTVSLYFLFTDPTMEAVQFDPKNKTLSLIRAPLPSEPNENEVVIRVVYSGICGTDLHITEVRNLLTGNCFSLESEVLFIIALVYLGCHH